MDDQTLVDEYLKSGVDLPELKEQDAQEQEPEAPKEEPKPEEPQEPLQEKEEQETRKRSIYDEYKEKKSELRTERELREQAERERDELRAKLEAVQTARTPQEMQDAQDELDSFAKEINADPESLKRLRSIILKDVQPDTSIQKEIQEFREWREKNAQLLEKQQFESEFTQSLDEIKRMFPDAGDTDLATIKSELDRLSHTKEFHDKELTYVAFKHRDELGKFVTPKKRGIEPKTKRDAPESSFEFDPEADIASLSPKEREQWMKEYEKAGRSTGLVTDANGKKIFI